MTTDEVLQFDAWRRTYPDQTALRVVMATTGHTMKAHFGEPEALTRIRLSSEEPAKRVEQAAVDVALQISLFKAASRWSVVRDGCVVAISIQFLKGSGVSTESA